MSERFCWIGARVTYAVHRMTQRPCQVENTGCVRPETLHREASRPRLVLDQDHYRRRYLCLSRSRGLGLEDGSLIPSLRRTLALQLEFEVETCARTA